MGIYASWDIETVPNERAEEIIDQQVFDPPANYKDPEKIKAHLAEAKRKAYDRAALNWWTGQIVSIAVSPPGEPSFVVCSDDESHLVRAFFDYVLGYPDLDLVGKSSDYFDTPFLIGRALALDLGLPLFLRRHHRGTITDVDQIFSFSASCDQRSNLANYAFGLGIEGKSGSGCQVAEWFQRAVLGEKEYFKRIADYNVQDTLIVLEMMKRFQKPYLTGG